ncbi:type II toxin-antitoxin system RelE/ParE family toxin [Candidatus Woesearchaeota archaeon]|nr:type II toxin-antitoxin system RelE/ParE family toxin [Candidatus Woesearchaeota archaeon]
MVDVIFDSLFEGKFRKIKDIVLKERVIKQIEKIKDNPEVGKPMRYGRKGTRELYISPYRISYFLQGSAVYILDFYHKDEQ